MANKLVLVDPPEGRFFYVTNSFLSQQLSGIKRKVGASLKNAWEDRGDHIVIFVKRRGEIHNCLISYEDFPKVNAIQKTWFINNYGYVYTTVRKEKKTSILLHRYIVDAAEGIQVDHINHNLLDNRRENIRQVSRAENQQNKKGPKSNSSTGVLGVHWDKRDNFYIARVRRNGKLVYSHYFKTLEEAEQAVIRARAELLPFSKEAREAKVEVIAEGVAC